MKQVIRATATDPDGSTSEFSSCIALTTSGDVDCDGDVDAVDSLKVLRFVGGLPVGQTEPCPDIGTALTITENTSASSSPFTKAMPFASALGLALAGVGGAWGISRRRGEH